MSIKLAPGQVRDAIYQVFANAVSPVSIQEINSEVSRIIGPTPQSSVRSYLQINTPKKFLRLSRGLYTLTSSEKLQEHALFKYGNATLYNNDCFNWLQKQTPNSIHAIVTDPPYGLFEYTDEQQEKLRNGKGGIWRIPPSFDGHKRSPLPRFTVLTPEQLKRLKAFFKTWAKLLVPVLVPGAHVIVASNPLLSYILSTALAETGLERRGEIIRLTMTMRGGDRPKGAHTEFPEVSVLPRSMWEPWVIFRKPLEGRVQDNLRIWRTGAFRRPNREQPFGDVIKSKPTHSIERKLASHPSLKPQAFLREIVRAVLPFGEGVVLDPFAGSGSTLAAAEAVKYSSIGIEKDIDYYNMAKNAIPRLAEYQPPVNL